MYRIAVSNPDSLIPNGIVLRYAAVAAQTERLKLRIAELDLAHVLEIKRLDALLRRTKQKFFLYERQKG
jgi:hypothetical protein